MVDWRYLVVDATSGVNVSEVEFTGVSYTKMLTGCGQWSGSIPADHPQATPAILRGDREVTCLRNNVAVWNGPITGLSASSAAPGSLIQVTAREASWYLWRRFLEIDKSWTGTDLFTILRWFVTYATSKDSTGNTSGGSSINSALPNFAVNPASATAGITKTLTYYGVARHNIGTDIIDTLAHDPTTGFDYRMDYTTSSTRQTCQRTFTLGSPSLGTAKTLLLTEHVLDDYGFTDDREQAATRVHVLGKDGKLSTQQNTGSVTAGEMLIEGLASRTDVSDQTQLDNYAKEQRRLAQPPVQTWTASFAPNDASAIAFDAFDLGDTCTLAITRPALFAVSTTQRIVQLDVTPGSGDAQDHVALTFNLPMSALGT